MITLNFNDEIKDLINSAVLSMDEHIKKDNYYPFSVKVNEPNIYDRNNLDRMVTVEFTVPYEMLKDTK